MKPRDANDVLREEGPDALRERLDKAPRRRPGEHKMNGQDNAPPADENEPLGEWDAGDDDELPPPRGWLLGSSFCRGFASSVLGEGAVGKSALRYAQALSLATGRSLTGEHVFKRSRVLLVSLEDGRDELKRRLWAAYLHHGIDRRDVKGWLFLAALGRSAGKLMTVDTHGRPVLGPLTAKLHRVIADRKIDISILDPFIKSHGIGENDNSGIDQVAQILTDMAEKFDIAVDVPHHMAKGVSDPGNASRGRGASSLKDALRLVRTATAMTTDEAKAFGLGEIERRTLFRLDDAKLNIAPSGQAKWFRLVGVIIQNGNQLYPNGDSVQTVETWTPPDLFYGVVPSMDVILADIDAGLPDGTRYSNAPKTNQPAWCVITKHCPGKREGPARQIIKAWLDSGLLIEAPYENPKTRKWVNGLCVNAKMRTS